MSFDSTKRQALEYVQLVQRAINGDSDAQEEVGEMDDAVEILCDYITVLCEKSSREG